MVAQFSTFKTPKYKPPPKSKIYHPTPTPPQNKSRKHKTPTAKNQFF